MEKLIRIKAISARVEDLDNPFNTIEGDLEGVLWRDFRDMEYIHKVFRDYSCSLEEALHYIVSLLENEAYTELAKITIFSCTYEEIMTSDPKVYTPEN